MDYLEKIEQFAKMEYAKHDEFHKWNHIEEVMEIADYLIPFYKNEIDLEILKIALILHDVTYSDYETHVDESVETAKKILVEIWYPIERIKRVTEVIYDHSWPHRRSNGEARCIEWMIIYDSDKYGWTVYDKTWFDRYFPQLYLQETKDLIKEKHKEYFY